MKSAAQFSSLKHTARLQILTVSDIYSSFQNKQKQTKRGNRHLSKKMVSSRRTHSAFVKNFNPVDRVDGDRVGRRNASHRESQEGEIRAAQNRCVPSQVLRPHSSIHPSD
mmetsp:Transcript_14065/g.20255  ORF Transcript_14065/g.20255 Transcript_14065/m.20255 type:complete len:110 (+) Transcript_14065:269-598(+)